MRRVDVPEEAGEPERMKPVGAEGVHPARVFVQQLSQALGSPQRRRLEHVELAAGRELFGFVAVAAVDSLEDVRHR